SRAGPPPATTAETGVWRSTAAAGSGWMRGRPPGWGATCTGRNRTPTGACRPRASPRWPATNRSRCAARLFVATVPNGEADLEALSGDPALAVAGGAERGVGAASPRRHRGRDLARPLLGLGVDGDVRVLERLAPGAQLHVEVPAVAAAL